MDIPRSEPHVPSAPAEPAKPWGQHRRLLFIDRRLQFEGRIKRADLTEFFGISVPQASQDLRRYDEVAPGNLRYDIRAKSYVASETFVPWTGETDARVYLRELQALADGVIAASASFVGFHPPIALPATPSRPLAASLVAAFVQAIQRGLAVEVAYQSMRQPEPAVRVISPHALGCDGLRWHVRAYCSTSEGFRDFAIGRCRWRAVVGRAEVDPASDISWGTVVSILLAPHPGLSDSQRAVVEHDYGITPGQTLEVPCRRAMLFYTLRHLNLYQLTDEADSARQHVVIVNKAEVRRWLKEEQL